MRDGFYWALAASFAIFGAAAIAVPADWYRLLPGASHTGPANHHFIRDVGIAYLTLALATAMAARKSRYRWPLMLVVAFNTIAHAGLHAVEHLFGAHAAFDYREAMLVYGSVPVALAALWLARPSRSVPSGTAAGEAA